MQAGSARAEELEDAESPAHLSSSKTGESGFAVALVLLTLNVVLKDGGQFISDGIIGLAGLRQWVYQIVCRWRWRYQGTNRRNLVGDKRVGGRPWQIRRGVHLQEFVHCGAETKLVNTKNSNC